jgi:hypothetical protein
MVSAPFYHSLIDRIASINGAAAPSPAHFINKRERVGERARTTWRSVNLIQNFN